MVIINIFFFYIRLNCKILLVSLIISGIMFIYRNVGKKYSFSGLVISILVCLVVVVVVCVVLC